MRAQNGTCSIFKGMFDMRRMDRTLAIALVALLGIGGLFEPAEAEEGKGFFTSRKSLGLAFLGSSLLLSKQGLDFRDEADKLAAHHISGILFGTPNGVTASRPGSEANLFLAFCQFDA
jgi:hypothetical protein